MRQREPVGDRVDAEAGQLGELDGDVRRGRTRRPRRTCAGRRTTAPGSPSSRCSTTWVCGGRGGAAVGDQQLAAHPQVDHQLVAGVEREQEVLPAPVGGGDRRAGQAVDRLPARDVRRTVRSRPTSTAFDAPADDEAVEAAPDRLDLGQLGHRSIETGVRRRRAGRTPRTRPCSAGFFERPSPSPTMRPSTHDRGEEALGVVGPLGAHDVDGRAEAVAVRASSCSARLVVEPVEAIGRRRRGAGANEALDQVVRGRRAAVEVDRAEHRLERVRQDRRLLAPAGRVLALAEQQAVADAELARPPRRGRWR